MTIFINLVGGPGCGKSTTAAGLYAELKKEPLTVEFLREPIQRHILEGNTMRMASQISLFAEDLLQMDSVNGKVDICIRDTSLLNNIVYDCTDNYLFHSLVLQEYHKYANLDFFINRQNIQFQEYGRIHTYQESLLLDERIKDIYRVSNIPLLEVDTTTAVVDILDYIKNENEQKRTPIIPEEGIDTSTPEYDDE